MNLVESLTTPAETPIETVHIAEPVPLPTEATPVTVPPIAPDAPASQPDPEAAQPANIAQLVDPPKALPPGKGKGQRKLSDYYSLDWSKTNSELAQEAGVTRQRIAQIRETIEKKRLAGEDVTSTVVESESTIPGFEAEPVIPVTQPEPAILKAVTDYRLLAETSFDMGCGLATMLIGPEWQPRMLKVGEQEINERNLVVDALQKYFTAKQVEDLPPGLMLTFVLVSYSAPRFAVPNTSSKVKLGWQWFKVKVGGLFKRKRQPLTILQREPKQNENQS